MKKTKFSWIVITIIYLLFLSVRVSGQTSWLSDPSKLKLNPYIPQNVIPHINFNKEPQIDVQPSDARYIWYQPTEIITDVFYFNPNTGYKQIYRNIKVWIQLRRDKFDYSQVSFIPLCIFFTNGYIDGRHISRYYPRYKDAAMVDDQERQFVVRYKYEE